MSWKCPACHTPIRQELTAAGHTEPVPHHVYRCSICRLELVVNDVSTAMIVAPIEPHPPGHQPKHK